METGAYLTKEVLDTFDKIERASIPNIRKAKRIIDSLVKKYNNAPYYTNKIELSHTNMTVDNLEKILGDFFFGSKRDTKMNFEDFIKIYQNISGSKPNVKDTKKDAPKEDVKSVKMELSDDLWLALEKIAGAAVALDDPAAWALINFVDYGQKKPGSNILAITYLDINEDNPSLFKVKLANGKSTKIPIFNLFKQYFPKLSGVEISDFVKSLSKVIVAGSFEDGEVIEVPEFKLNPKDIRATFLSMVTETYPKGHEEEVVKFLPTGLTKDEFGNYYKVIGKSDVMFTSHLDTVSSKTDVTLISRKVDGQEIISSDGTSILGADDKAGVTVLLYMMAHNIPGVYYFFVGEESGGIGSGNVAESFLKFKHLKGIKKCVSFDRRNYYSVITSQMYDVCCSDEFAHALCSELNKSGLKMGLDPTGVFTDSANFMELIPECTNISVGYFNEHTYKEALNIDFLEKLADACLKVNWTSLPVARFVDMSEDMIESWGDVIEMIEETGTHNDLKFSGDKNKLLLKLDFEQTSLEEAYSDISNLEYIFSQFRLQPKISFKGSVIKFEIS
jgi:hypothetical protein